MRPAGVKVKPTGGSSRATVTTRTSGAPPADAGAEPRSSATTAVAAPSAAVRRNLRTISVLLVAGAPWDHGPVTTLPPSMFGVPALRSEDPRFLTGRARYLENLPIEGALRAVFVRSIMPHARLHAVQADEALRMPGVAGVFTAGDLDLPRLPASGVVEGGGGVLEGPFGREALARDVVRFTGEAIAVVVADSLAHAEDAAEVVFAVMDPLPAVTDVEAALADDSHAGADVVVRGRFVNQRVAPDPMEGNAIAVEPHRVGKFTVWVSTQLP